jgi:hypothetical protein
MDKSRAASIIQGAYKQFIYARSCIDIFHIYKLYFPKLFPRGKMRTLTSWETLAGFNERGDSLKNFQQHLGSFWEEIMGVVPWYTNLPTDGSHGGCDGISDSCFYEVKSRYNTMKGSMAFDEIERKLRHSIENDKDFKLLVLVDKNNNSRNIPLHEGNALKKIRDIPGYNEYRHRWISDKEVFNHIFGFNSDKVYDFISQLFRYTNPN